MKLVVTTAAPTQAEIDAAALRRLGGPGPQSTAYREANHFTPNLDAEAYRQALRQRAEAEQCEQMRADAVVGFTDKGWFYVRAIAMLFDRHPQPDPAHRLVAAVV